MRHSPPRPVALASRPGRSPWPHRSESIEAGSRQAPQVLGAFRSSKSGHGPARPASGPHAPAAWEGADCFHRCAVSAHVTWWRGHRLTALQSKFALRRTMTDYKIRDSGAGLRRDLIPKKLFFSRHSAVSPVALSCPSLTRFLPFFFHLVRVGEALPAYTLHHKHHAVMLLILSTTPPHLAGPRRRSRRCAVHVQLSEAPPVVALGLDRIARRRR
jgi:hypothetical protein